MLPKYAAKSDVKEDIDRINKCLSEIEKVLHYVMGTKEKPGVIQKLQEDISNQNTKINEMLEKNTQFQTRLTSDLSDLNINYQQKELSLLHERTLKALEDDQESLTTINQGIEISQMTKEEIESIVDEMHVQVKNVKETKEHLQSLINDQSNTKNNHKKSTMSQTSEILHHLSFEAKEVDCNQRNKEKLVIKLDKDFHPSLKPLQRVHETFKILSYPQRDQVDLMMNMIVSAKKVNKNSQNIVILQIHQESIEDMTSFLSANRLKEDKFQIKSFLTKDTRLKKGILGHIAKNMCLKKAGSACVPKFTNRAVMVIQKDGSIERTWLKYHEVLLNEEYMEYFSEEDKAYFLKNCHDKNPYRQKVKLLL